MSAKRDRLRVLLIWPGGVFVGGGNFGVPQLLSLAAAIRKSADADVTVVDFDCERAFGPIDLGRLLEPGYDLVGLSCYSSYDFLKVTALAERVREHLPRAWIVAGGYHASARPAEFTADGAPFDFVVVGDGESPLARLAAACAAGKRPLVRELGPESVPEPSTLLPYDWSLLERYRPIARRVATQAEIYLSRGCPYDCSFCMERAKRDTSWRSLTAEEAYGELERLDRFLDLTPFTLFIADALFGMKRSFRRELLEALARRPLRAIRVWLLIRVDLVDREDLALMARANVSPGFGLESGDPEQLRRIRKSGNLAGYLEKMRQIAGWAREYDVPFGANVIVGHPGETEATLRASARYLNELFLGDALGTHGFLSVDPFRLYPGSPIDAERSRWEAETGMRVHRYPWWHDGDQDFLSEWVDPSGELDFLRCLELREELFDPILRAVPRRFAYQGPAREYFMKAVREQAALADPRAKLRTLGLHRLWSELVGQGEPRVAPAADALLAKAALAARRATLAAVGGLRADVRAALERVPRERFVTLETLPFCADNVALPLCDDQSATISSLDSYARVIDLLELGPGDELVELGAGTGYGAALAAEIVGAAGRVLALELDAALADGARRNLTGYANVEVCELDAHRTETWQGARRVACSFALDALPEAWAHALAEGALLVAPVGGPERQALARFEKRNGAIVRTDHGAVRYVPDRTGRPASDRTRSRQGAGSASSATADPAPK